MKEEIKIKKNKSIVILSRGIPDSIYPMNGIFEFDQAVALKKEGVPIIFVAVDIRSIRRKRKFGFEKYYKNNILVYSLNMPIGRVPLSISNYFRLLGTEFLLKKISKDGHEVSGIHAHFTEYGYIASIIKQKYSYTAIMTEHFSGLMKNPIENKRYMLSMNTYKFLDKVIVVSEGLQTAIDSNFSIESTYIPNIVDTDLFGLKKLEKRGSIRFISVSGLIKGKSIDLSIKSFNNILTDYPDSELVIVGDGPEKEHLINLVNNLKIENSVIFTGQLSRDKISRELQNSDIFVLPSQSETFGVAYIEAMSCGLPVIATKCGGPEQFVRPFNGVLIEVGDSQSLTRAMKYTIDNFDNYNPHEIRNYIVDNFSETRVAKEIIKQYKELEML